MRAFGPLCLLSLDLWAGLAWCFVVLRMVIGTDHLHLDAHDLGVWLLGVDAALVVAVIWLRRLMATAPD